MSKVLAIVGSPRKKKNNDQLVDSFLRAFNGKDYSIKKLYVSQLEVKPCIACDGCTRQKGCVFDDDMSQLYTSFNEADIILVSSPLYFNSISAQLKSIVDRCQAIWSSKYALNDSLIDRNKKRVGFFIGTAGMPEDPSLFQAVPPIMDLFFKAINAEYTGNLFISNVDKNPVFENELLLEKAYQAGLSLEKNWKK